MAKHKAVGESEHKAVSESEIKAAIKAALSAIGHQERLDISQAGLARRAGIPSLRRKLGKQLQPVFAEAGLDVAKIKKIRADHQSEVRGVLKKEKSKSAKAFAALNKNLRSGIENQKKALEHLASQPLIITRIPLWTAFDLTVLPGNLQYESHAGAADNWVTTYFNKENHGPSEDGTVDVFFWFYWRNPFSYPAVLNADSQLVLQGTYWLRAFTDLLRVRPGTSSGIAEFSKQETDGGELEEGERGSVEVLPVLGQSPAAVKPGDGALDDPALRERDEAFDPIRAFADFGFEMRQDAGQRGVKDRPLVGAVGEQLFEIGEQAEQRRQ